MTHGAGEKIVVSLCCKPILGKIGGSGLVLVPGRTIALAASGEGEDCIRGLHAEMPEESIGRASTH